MHISSRAPLLSAAASMVCIWIMAAISSLGRARQHFHHAEMLGLGQRPALGDPHQVTLVALAFLVVRVQLGRTAQQLAVHAVLLLPIDADRHGLGSLAAGDATLQGARAARVALVLCVVHHAAPWVCFSTSTVAARAISRRTRANWWVWAFWPCAFCMRRLNCSRRRSAIWSLRSCSDLLRISWMSITAAPWSRIGFAPTAWPPRAGTPHAPRLR